MTVSWESDYRPGRLAQLIEENTSRDESGRVSFGAFRFAEHEALLYSMLKFPDDIPETDARELASQAIMETAGSGTVTHQRLLENVNRLVAGYLARPLNRYVLVSSMSLFQFSPLRRCRFGDTIIIFESHPPLPYQKAAEALTMQARHILLAEIPDDHISVRVHVSARSASQAADKAFYHLDLVRGVWNWYYNRARPMRTTFGKRSPVNSIVLGPINTLHHFPTGKLASPGWWYESEYYGAARTYNPSRDIENLYKYLQHVRKKLSRCSYQSVCEESLIRYTRALDLVDWEAAFLRLWGVLELLTNSSKVSNDVTVRRAAAVFRDVEYAQQVLKHLQHYRNRFVHADASNSKIETYLYQLKRYVEALLGFHLGSTYGFQSVEDASQFLDLTADRLALESRIERLRYAQRFRGYT
jgi:hypothetical protein